MDANTLVEVVTALTLQGHRIVSSKQLKSEFDRRALHWGAPHGWPIREAEDVEMATYTPRLVKWRLGNGDRGMIGYSLVGDQTAEALAVRRGYRRLRN